MEMHPWMISLLALAGSAIGALASVAATWVAQYYRDQAERLKKQASRRERLFGAFVDQASQSYAAGMVQESLDDPAQLVPLYATINKLRLFASSDTLRSAEAVLECIVETYQSPVSSLKPNTSNVAAHDILRTFAESCRTELTTLR